MAQAQGALGQILTQMETAFKTAPTGIKTRKCYFASETLKKTQGRSESNVIQGSSRHPTEGFLDNVELAGDINTEMIADSFLWGAALGSVQITATGPTVGTAITSPTFAYDWTNQILTVNSTSHGMTIGDTAEIIATAPTIMNGTFYYPVISVPTANQFMVWVPMGGSGTVTVTTIKKCTAGTFTYTYKGGGRLPSYILERGFPDIAQYFKYTGSVCGGLTLQHSPTGVITLGSSWMAGAMAPSGTSYETGTAVDNGKAVFDAFKLAAADMKEGGSATTKVRSLSMRLDNRLDGDTFVLGGQGARAGINPGVYQISGSMEATFEDLTLYNKAANGTESSFDLTYKRGTGAGTAGNEYCQIVVPALKFSLADPNIEGPRGVVLRLDYLGYYYGTDVTALKAIIKSPILPGQCI